MSDRLAELLQHTADQWSQDAVPPPLPEAWRQGRDGFAWRRWAPLAAAAAIIAVAVPAGLVGQRVQQPAPISAAQPPVGSGPEESRQLRATDAGLPKGGIGPAGDPNAPTCASEHLTATLDLEAGALSIAPKPGRFACNLPAGIVVSAEGVEIVRLQQPDVPTPPQFSGTLLDARGVVMDARWRGDCKVLPASAQVRVDTAPLPVQIAGAPKSCSPDEAPRLELGPARRVGEPGGLVPADRAGLTLRLEVPDSIAPGATFDYTVTLTNPTAAPITLRPCPTFYALLSEPQLGAGGEPGRLPCDRLPSALPARSEVAVVLTTQLFNGGNPSEDRGTATLDWRISGTERVTAQIPVVHTTPTELPAVPYRAPGGEPENPRRYRYTGSGSFPVIIEGPRTAKAGEVLRYRAVLTNPPGGEPIPLQPCPTWTETFVVAPAVSSNPTPVIRTGLIDCSRAPEQIPPGAKIAFEMELTVPQDSTDGPHQLFWQLQGGLDSEPFDLTVQ